MTETTTEIRGHLVGTAERPVVVVDRELAATTTEVWDAWTQPEQLLRWLGAVDGALTTPGRPVRVAMTADELPEAGERAENLATFTVSSATPPVGDGPACLVFTFDDAADPGGEVTVELTPLERSRCRLVLRHTLLRRDGAIEQAPGFGAGWEGFLDWLEDALAGRAHGQKDRYEELLPSYERLGARLALVHDGELGDGDEGARAVRHRRVIRAAPEVVWDVLTSADSLGEWLGTVVDGSLEDGGTVVIVHDEHDPERTRQTSTVVAWEPPTRVVMTWAMPGEPTSELELTLRAEGEATVLELVHRGIGTECADYLPGWHAHLDLLTATVEGHGRPPFAEAFAAAART